MGVIGSLVPARFKRNQFVVPVVRLSGAIMPSTSPLRQTLSLANVASVLDRAFQYWRNVDADLGARIEKAVRAGGVPEPADGMGEA